MTWCCSPQPEKAYNLKESDSKTHHNKALTNRALHPEKSPHSQLVLGLCPTYHNHHIRQNQIIKKLKEQYLAHWQESTKNLSQLACYSSLAKYHCDCPETKEILNQVQNQ